MYQEFAREHPQFSIKEVQCNCLEFPVAKKLADNGGNEKKCEMLTEVGKRKSEHSALPRSNFHGKGISVLISDLFDFLSMNDKERARRINCGLSSDPKSKTSSRPTDTTYFFSAIYDRGSMVAVKPSLRNDYVTLMGALLVPGGTILLVTIDRRKAANDEIKVDGPPFSLNEMQVRQLYQSQPWVESVTMLEEVNGMNTKLDRERWEKRGVSEMYELVFLIRKRN